MNYCNLLSFVDLFKKKMHNSSFCNTFSSVYKLAMAEEK